MSLAPARSLGAFLKARLAVNGIQCAARSFGTLTAEGRGLLSSMGGLLAVFGVMVTRRLSASSGDGNRQLRAGFEPVGLRAGPAQRSDAPIQNTSPSDSSVSSQRNRVCGNAASSAGRQRPISHNSPPPDVRC